MKEMNENGRRIQNAIHNLGVIKDGVEQMENLINDLKKAADAHSPSEDKPKEVSEEAPTESSEL